MSVQTWPPAHWPGRSATLFARRSRAGALRAFVFVFLALGAGVCAAQITDRGIDYRVPSGDGKELVYHFPYLEAVDHSVADRINTYLHVEYLKVLPAPLAGAWKPGAAPIGLAADSSLNEIRSEGVKTSNGGRILSVSLFLSGCGAYCSEASDHVEFDSRTGRLIVGAELVTKAGLAVIARESNRAHAAILAKEIARLEKQIASNKRSKERSLEDMGMQLEIYQSCLDSRYTGEAAEREGTPELVSVGEASIHYFHGDCSSHASRALDDLGEYTYKRSAQQMRPYLTAYGKYLLLGEGDGAIPAISPVMQIFKGTIGGKYPVTLALGGIGAGARLDQRASSYFYDKHRKSIALRGVRKGAGYEFAETDSKETPKPVLSFWVEGDKLRGTWRGAGKTLSFEATP
ncbi:MAG: hypothetical protein V4582_07590 [Pseudomonadota bacterium]